MESTYRKLPPEAEAFLKNEKINAQDILYTAETDLDAEGRFADGYLVLTKSVLGVIQAPVMEGKVHYFRGSDSGKNRKASMEAGSYMDVKAFMEIGRAHV